MILLSLDFILLFVSSIVVFLWSLWDVHDSLIIGDVSSERSRYLSAVQVWMGRINNIYYNNNYTICTFNQCLMRERIGQKDCYEEVVMNSGGSVDKSPYEPKNVLSCRVPTVWPHFCAKGVKIISSVPKHQKNVTKPQKRGSLPSKRVNCSTQNCLSTLLFTV